MSTEKETTPNIDVLHSVDHLFNPQRVVGNIIFLGGGEMISRALAFVATAYLARRLGPTGFGTIGFAIALCGTLSLPVNSGFNEVGAREVAYHPQRASSIAFSGILSKLVLAITAMGIVVLVTQFLGKPAQVQQVVILTSLSFIPLALDPSWVFKGLERNRPPGVALVIGQALYLAAVLNVVRGPADLARVPLAQVFGDGSAAIGLAVLIFSYGSFKLDIREGLKIFHRSGFLILTRLLRTVIFSFDVLLLGFLLGEREVGLYVAPYRICFLLLSVATAIHISYLPAVARAQKQGTRNLELISDRALNFAAIFATPLTVGGIILAAPILTTVFGSTYAEGAAAFRLLIISIGFIFAYGVIHNILLGYDRLKTELWIMAAAAGLNVALNFVLIPRYRLVGAAMATVLAEGLALLLGLVAIHHGGVQLKFQAVLRPLIAAGVMAVCLVALGTDRPLALSLGMGVVVYGAVLVAVRGIPQDIRLDWRNK